MTTSALQPLRQGDPASIGGYRLLGLLGEGGQGTVYRAEGEGGQQVVVKLLHARLAGDADAHRRFLREAEAARKVAPFCTAGVLAAGIAEDGRPYIVSEFVVGVTLLELVRTQGPRTGSGLARLAVSTVSALEAIHRAGVVHRDFKPANVLMGAEGPVVIDFGVARDVDRTTQTVGIIGTPRYMSPEQVGGGPIGPASDVFSWAATMVFAATGHPAFPGDAMPAVLNAVLNGEPDLSGVPEPTAALLRACLAKDPAARPSVSDIRETLSGNRLPAPQQPSEPTKHEPAKHEPVKGHELPSTMPTPVSPPHPLPPPVAYRPLDDRQHTLPPPNPESTAEPTRPPSPRRIPRRAALLAGGALAACLPFVYLFARPDDASPDPEAHTRVTPATPAQAPSPVASAVTPPPFGRYMRQRIDLAELGGKLTGLAVTSLDATTVAVTAHDNGRVGVWDLRTGALVAKHTESRAGGVTAVGGLDGRPVLAYGNASGAIRLWDLRTGESLAEHDVRDPIIGVFPGERPVAVSQKYDPMRDLRGTVRFWDMRTGRQIGPTDSRSHWQGVDALTSAGGLIVTGDGGETVRRWDPADGKMRGSFDTGRIGGIDKLVSAVLDGDAVLVSAHLDATLRIWNPATGKRLKKWPFSDYSPDDRGVASMAVTTVGADVILVTVHLWDKRIRAWDLKSGKRIGEPFAGIAETAVAAGTLDGVPVAVAHWRGTLRVWSLAGR
ncbi:WD40 repeat domain-containing serine/threonine protein kinase [Sinosporangium siamense]|uniref:WD40 repeat domain-containing serine/threonine protein kinase n=1 Tax=Sinosporangium siamense TaxID=1367973 RepID=UPI0035EE17E9